MTLQETRTTRLSGFVQFADSLQRDYDWIYSLLRMVSPKATALDEIVKTQRALRTYSSELRLLANREPIGEVGVSLPFNNPLYSLVLYTFGSLLGGSNVTVRPSSITSNIVSEIYNRYKGLLSGLGLMLSDESGSDFIHRVASDPRYQSLVFAGSYTNILSLRTFYPRDKILIYCGSGINPFIVAHDAFADSSAIDRVVELAVSSKLYNSGQDCLCAERFYVHSSVYDCFLEHLIHCASKITTGGFADEAAEVTPLLGGLSERLNGIVLERRDDSSVTFHYAPPVRDDLFPPTILSVPLGDPLLYVEKFGPVFVVAAYSETDELDTEMVSDYRFGATVCGTYWSSALDDYPHAAKSQSIIEIESKNAHVPFGGRGKSGFVASGCRVKDGPILYSVETTRARPRKD